MPHRARSRLDGEARRRLGARMQAAGARVRAARLRRSWGQAELGKRVGLSQSAVSRLELGEGAALSVFVWERVAMALELPLRFELGRDSLELPAGRASRHSGVPSAACKGLGYRSCGRAAKSSR